MTVAPARDGALPRWQRSLLPAVLGAAHADDPYGGQGRDASGASQLPRSARDWLVDICMFGLALIVGVAVMASNWHASSPALLAVDGVLGVAACLGLWVRRRHPLVLGYATACVSAVSGLADGAALAALFTVAVYCAPRHMLQVGLLTIAAAAVYPAVYPQDGQYDVASLLFGIAFAVVAMCFGSFVRVRRELVISLHERARRLQDEQHGRVREAQRAERARIAREMHDVLAHRISLLSVHAGALEFRPDAPPEEIARAASVIRVSARAAQEELREVIGVLRTESGEEAAASPDATVQPPQPTIADLSMLVQESRRAGMDVRLHAAVDQPTLAPTLGRTVYRLVQEALTNARKHAPRQVVTIEVDAEPDRGVRVEVVNRPAVGEADVPSDAAAAAELLVGSGTGLIGLGERVALVGGELAHGPLPGGGYVVRAVLPWMTEA